LKAIDHGSRERQRKGDRSDSIRLTDAGRDLVKNQ
jgi:hypothetical protein